MSNQQKQSGIVSFGNWIVDKISMVGQIKPLIDPQALQQKISSGYDVINILNKIEQNDFSEIDDILVHPIVTEGQLTSITAVSEGTGGSPYNVLLDVAKLGNNIPLGAVGIIGNDPDGQGILNDLKEHNIDSSGMIMKEGQRTSFTNVYQPVGGNRGFAHYSVGTNDELSDKDIIGNLDYISKYKYCHAGYAMLLATLDSDDSEYGTPMAHALKIVQDKSVKTSLSVVSSREVDKFRKVVTSSLRYTNVHMPNEYEATHTTGINVRDKNSARDAATKMFDEFGVGDLVVIHMGDKGSLGMLSDGTTHYQPVHKVDKIEVTAGAGDAFEAGMLYALHEDKGLEYGMRLGTAMAAICLGGKSCTDAMQNLTNTEKYMDNTPYRT